MMNTEERCKRHLSLPGFGKTEQDRLINSTVVIVGCGGLGIPASLYLTGSGVGQIVVIDNDTIELSNLHRQPLYTEDHLGKPKSEILGQHLRKLNSEVSVTAIKGRLIAENAAILLQTADLVLDCSDNFPTRYLINDACVKLGIPFVSAAIYRYEGQLGLFNYQNGPTYRCFAPEMPSDNVVDCNVAGVMGTLPGILGTMQANEAIKVLINSKEVLRNKIMLFSALTYVTSFFNLEKNEAVYRKTIQGKFNIENQVDSGIEIETLSEKYSMEHLQFIDVREKGEFPVFESNEVLHMPQSTGIDLDRIDSGKTIICFCQSGIRSQAVAKSLNQQGFSAFSLNHGIRGLLEKNIFKPINESIT